VLALVQLQYSTWCTWSYRLGYILQNMRFVNTGRRLSLLDRPKQKQAKLICRKCESALAPTNDLYFLTWYVYIYAAWYLFLCYLIPIAILHFMNCRKNGVHVASINNLALENLKSETHTAKQTWKNAKLSCITCDNGLATMATIRGKQAILFASKDVSLQLPLGTSPILSMSGLPSDFIRFSK